MERSELWRLARDDAGFGEDDAVWIEIAGEPPSGHWAAGAVPGEHIDKQIISLETQQQAWSTTHLRKIRAFTYAAVRDEESLGLMRWALESARLGVHHPGATQLVAFVHYAHQHRISEGGLGGASYLHKSPEQRQADAVSSALVNRVFGPQSGQLHGKFGALMRSEGEEMTDDVFGRRAVAYAAFHDEDITSYNAAGRPLWSYLDAVDPTAQAWHQTLCTDNVFTRLSRAAVVVVPTASESADAFGQPSDLWNTVNALWLRAELRALALLPPLSGPDCNDGQ